MVIRKEHATDKDDCNQDFQNLRTAIERALSSCVGNIKLPGITDAALGKVKVSSKRLRYVANRLEKDGHMELYLSAEVELFLRISNTDVLSSVEGAEFLVQIIDQDGLCVSASTEKDWGAAWEQGIEPLKDAAVEGMRQDLWSTDGSLPENSHTFQAGMVLLASEFVGPYIDRIVTLLRYPRGFVQVIATRLQEAKVWEIDEVRCEEWFDAEKGGTAFLLDLMVAEGKLTRRWSEEKMQYAYQATNIKTLTQFAI